MDEILKRIREHIKESRRDDFERIDLKDPWWTDELGQDVADAFWSGYEHAIEDIYDILNKA